MDTKPKSYTILKTVQGSRDGLKVETFKKGEIHELDESLAEQLYHLGAVEEITGKAAGKNPAESRETKVSGPTEYKGEEGEAGIDPRTQRIEELNATARDHFGLDTDTTMEPQAIRDAIDAASDGEEDELPASDAEPLTTESASKPKKGKK